VNTVPGTFFTESAAAAAAASVAGDSVKNVPGTVFTEAGTVLRRSPVHALPA